MTGFMKKATAFIAWFNTFVEETSVINQAVTSPPLGPALAKDIPEVERAVRIDPGDAVMAVEDKSFLERGIITDQSFFEVFDFRLLSGDRNSALKEPYSVILSQSLAEKYFGKSDAVGQLVKIFSFDADGNGAQYKVTGVIENCPENSHFFYDYVISFNTWETYNPAVLEHNMWFNNGRIYTYILLHPDSDPAQVQAKIPGLVETYIGKEMRENKFSYEYTLQALTDIHLYSNLSYEIGPNGSVSYVIIFGNGRHNRVAACLYQLHKSHDSLCDRPTQRSRYSQSNGRRKEPAYNTISY